MRISPGVDAPEAWVIPNPSHFGLRERVRVDISAHPLDSVISDAHYLVANLLLTA